MHKCNNSNLPSRAYNLYLWTIRTKRFSRRQFPPDLQCKRNHNECPTFVAELEAVTSLSFFSQLGELRSQDCIIHQLLNPL